MKIFLSLLIFIGLNCFGQNVTGPVSVQLNPKSEETVASLKEKIIDIQNKGELGISKFTLCSNVLGFGQYVPIANNQVKAGSKVYFYYEPLNLFTNRKDGIYAIWFTQDMILKSEDGTELLNSKDALNFNYQAVSPVMDIFATNSLDLGKLPPGIYQFIVVIKDKFSNKTLSYGYNFQVIE